MRVKGFTDGTIAIISNTFYRLGREAADAEEKRPGCDAVMPLIEKMQALRDRCRAWESVQRRQKRRAESLQRELEAMAALELMEVRK